MIFEQIATGGCQSYLVGCADDLRGRADRSRAAPDRPLPRDRRPRRAAHPLPDRHAHACRPLLRHARARATARRAGRHAHARPAPFAALRVDDGEMLAVGNLRLQVMHTPGHTRDSICLLVGDRVFTGDTLLIGGTGRTDLPTGDPNALYDSLFNGILKLDPGAQGLSRRTTTRAQGSSTLAREIADEPAPAEARPRRVRRHDAAPEPLGADASHRGAAHEHDRRQDGRAAARRGGRRACRSCRWTSSTRASAEATRRWSCSTCARATRSTRRTCRARSTCRAASSSCASTRCCPIRRARIVTVCEFGKISTLAAATLRDLGFLRAAALDGGMKAWRDGGFPVEAAAAAAKT